MWPATTPSSTSEAGTAAAVNPTSTNVMPADTMAGSSTSPEGSCIARSCSGASLSSNRVTTTLMVPGLPGCTETRSATSITSLGASAMVAYNSPVSAGPQIFCVEVQL